MRAEPVTLPIVPPHVRQRRRARGQRLRLLGFPDYNAYLRSPHWSELKERYRASDLPQECMCGEIEGLQLHHKTYERIGHEELTDLILLCSGCHNAIHVLEFRGDTSLNPAELYDAHRANLHRAERQRVRAIAEQAHEQTERRRQIRRNEAPLPARLVVCMAEAKEAGVDISGQLRVIQRRIVAIETTLAERRLRNAR